MAYVNNHHEPEPIIVDSKIVLDLTIPYDFNCYYTGGELANDRIKLVPFVVSPLPYISTASLLKQSRSPPSLQGRSLISSKMHHRPSHTCPTAHGRRLTTFS